MSTREGEQEEAKFEAWNERTAGGTLPDLLQVYDLKKNHVYLIQFRTELVPRGVIESVSKTLLKLGIVVLFVPVMGEFALQAVPGVAVEEVK